MAHPFVNSHKRGMSICKCSITNRLPICKYLFANRPPMCKNAQCSPFKGDGGVLLREEETREVLVEQTDHRLTEVHR